MKKLLTAFVAMFVGFFFANAQVTIIFDPDDVWQDGSGYQLLLDADHNTFGTTIPATGGITTDCDVDASLYDVFEYTIPENADASCEAENIIMGSSQTISIPAGTYDYCVTNPTTDERIWIAGGTDARGNDITFVNGWTYHFRVYGDSHGDTVSIEVTCPQGVVPGAFAFNFSTMVGMSVVQSTSISLVEVSSATATTTAPFEVSADGETFGSTATFTEDGTLYIKFNPSTDGTFTDNVVLAAEGIDDISLSLTGTAIDCGNTEIPYATDFSNENLNDCWLIEDANNDDNTFDFSADGAYYNYSDEENANDWLISPAFTLTGHEVAYVDYRSRSAYYSEKFEVYVIQNDVRTLIIPEIEVTNTSFVTLPIDIHSYTGETRIAFRCTSDADQYALYLTNFKVELAGDLTANPEIFNFGTIIIGNESVQPFYITTSDVNEDIDVTTTAPYAVSLDGITFDVNVTLPANSDFLTADTLYVKYEPVTAQFDSAAILISTSDKADTIILTGNGFECTPIEAPYSYNFTDNTQNMCWQIVDNNGDNKTFAFQSGGGAKYTYNSSEAADDDLISPEFVLTGNEYLYFDYKAESATYPEKLSVHLLQGEEDITLVPAFEITTTSYETLPVDLTPYTGNYQIAFHAESDANMYNLYVANILLTDSAPTPTLEVMDEEIDFGIIYLGNSSVETSEIHTIAIFDAINITTEAPFEVSLDDSTYNTTITIPASTDLFATHTLYIKYTPTMVNVDNALVIVTAGDLADTIAVSGEGYDCTGYIDGLPYTEDFNARIRPPLCWTATDESSILILNIDTTAGDYGIALGDVNTLVSPEIGNNADAFWVSLDYAAYYDVAECDGPNVFRIGYSSTDNAPESFTWLDPITITGDLAAFVNYRELVPGNTKYVAIDVQEIGTYYYWGMFPYGPNYLFIDNFTMTPADPEIVVNPTAINFGFHAINTTAVETATVTGAKLTTNITATTAAPFAVSTDGVNFSTTVTLDTVGGTLYVQFAPTAGGTFTDVVTLESDTIHATITLSGSSADCSISRTLPFTEDFEGDLACWQNLDEDGDGFFWRPNGERESAHNGNGCYMSESYDNTGREPLTPNNWLITPQIEIPENGANLSWYDAAQDPSYPAEHYHVMVSTTNNLSDFVSVFEITLSDSAWNQRNVSLSNYANQSIYIAFVHNNCSDEFEMKIDDINITEGTGIKENTAENAVSIFPNPTHNVLNIAANNFRTVEIVNFLGQVIYTAQMDGHDQVQVNTAHLAPGVYFVRLTGDNVVTKKFIKK